MASEPEERIDSSIDSPCVSTDESLEDKKLDTAKRLAKKAAQLWDDWRIRSVAYSALLTLALFAITRFVPSMPPILIAVIWAIASVFAAVRLAYCAVIKRTHKQSALRAGGCTSRFNQGRILALIVSFVLAAVGVGILFLSMVKWGAVEWLVIACGPLLFIPATIISEKIAHREFADTYLTVGKIKANTLVLFLMLIVIYIPALLIAGGFDAPDSAAQAVADSVGVFDSSPSAVISELGKLTALVDGMTAFALGHIAETSEWLYVVIKIMLTAMAFLAYTGLISAISIKHDELLRIFRPIETGEALKETSNQSEIPPQPKRIVRRYAATAVILPLILIAAFPAVDKNLEQVTQSEPYTRVEQFVRDQVDFMAVTIDGKYYDPAAIQALEEEALARYDALTTDAREQLTAIVNEMCDQQIANVDSYLDWYYSLTADYERLAGLFTGTLEEGMAKQLEQRLSEGVDTSKLDALLNDFASQAEAIRAEFEMGLSEHEITGIPGWLVTESRSIASADLLTPPQPTQQLLEFRERTVVSVGAGVASGILAKRAAGKIVTSEAFEQMTKKLASALTRSGIVKAATSAIGTVITPGAGTAAGVAAGIGITVATDYLLLKADEALNRESYKAEIIASIEEGRTELLGLITS